MALKINSIIFRDINLLFSVDEFSKEFTGYFIVSLINFFFKYNQIILNVRNRNIIVFITSFKFFRIIIPFINTINFIV